MKLVHKTGGRTNRNESGTVFFANQLNFWGQTTLVLGLLKLEISLSFDKKYFARNHFRFVIFSLF